MSTPRRETIRDEIQDALEDIDVANFYDRAASKHYSTTVNTVSWLVQGPDQVDGSLRPFIGFKQMGDEVQEYFPGHQMRVTIPWRAYYYPDLDLVVEESGSLWTQINGGLADIKRALYKSARVEGNLRDCISILNVTGTQTSEGDLAGDRGFGQVDLATIHWEKTDA